MRLGILFLAVVVSVFAHEKTETNKHKLLLNMTQIYQKEPPKVQCISEMFTEGIWYGRLRTNNFGFKWKDELQVNGKEVRKDHALAGFGGSLIYRSGYLYGFGVGAGVYASMGIGTLKRNEAYLYKSGKDMFSRYDKLTKNKNTMFSLAQAYIEYNYQKSKVTFGRQIFESFLTRSNDTKMIPNTFEGLTFVTKEIPQTTLKAAYLTRQKLKDHTKFHHVLAWATPLSDNPYTVYTQNDDTAMHRGLTLERLQQAGIHDRLFVFEIKNQSIERLQLRANYTEVPELLSSAMVQADYTFDVGIWHIIPSIRYMQQFDNGAGTIGGAALKGKSFTQGYRNPTDLDSWLLGVRTDIIKGAFKLRLGYTKVADRGDIVAPWRGFPTAGFTRAISQYNWYADTKTYMVQVGYRFKDLKDLSILGRYAYQDFDDNKPAVQADSHVLSLDVMKGFNGICNRYVKVRYAHVWGKPQTGEIKKLDPSYDELRIEFNYLF
ncbi:hypothetical protein MNB_SV-4-1284 [hydrothermal vent metagenome]|uniref:Outer membrane porin, OprD family n=1 Tax=hydrothermal vent metagenome TaxID=652676 RepID=A0A1W1E8B2_9ZZZZ